MTADFLEYFYSNEYDEKIVLRNSKKDFTILELKTLVGKKMDFLKTVSDKDIVLDGEDNFEFIINFLACLFLGKNIYLMNNSHSNSKMFNPKNIYGKTPSEFTKINPDKIEINFFTSGSSGTPEQVKKSLTNLIKEAQDLKDELEIQAGLEFISTTTMNHLFGMTFHFMLPLNSQGIINTDSISYPEHIKIQNACLVSSPSFLEKLNKYNEVPQVRPVRIITAGAKLEETAFNYALSISDNVTEIYGSTETGVVARRHNPKENLKHFRNVQLTSIDYGTKISTPYSFDEYNIVADKIEILKNNEIRLLGRLDRVLKIQEKRISAAEIENLLNNHEYVKSSYVTKTDEKLGCLTALNSSGQDFVLRNGIPALKKVLKNYLNNDFEIIPQKWKFTDEIPTDKRGKVDKEKIEKIFNLNLSIPLILEKKHDEYSAQIDLYFYRHCNFFKGHFEKYPIVPGVVQLFFAQYFANDIFGINCTQGQIRKIKFSNIIKPDKIITLTLEKHENGVEYKFTDENKKYSSGVLPVKNILEDK